MRNHAIRLAIVSMLIPLFSCVEQEEDKPTTSDLAVAKQNILSAAPAPRYPVNADLDGKVVYLGLDVEPLPIEPGKDVKLTHYWKVVAPPPPGEGWKIFTHVEGPGKQNYINADHAPVQGKYPVSAWKAGDIVRDVHTVRIPSNWPTPVVEVYVGLWRGAQRMPIRSGPHDAEGRVLAASIPVHAAMAAEPRRRYLARMITKPPKLDGKLDDPAWVAATSTGPFVNTLTGAPVAQRTEAKLLWDSKYLYVGFDNADNDVWSDLTKRDDKLWTEEADEIMIDADGNGRTYIELQVAPNGNVFDTYLPERRRYEDTINPKLKPFAWNSKLTAKVHVDGTLNKRDDQDKGWTAVLAIPLDDVKGMDDHSAVKLPPSPGDVWRINMYRMDQPKGKPQQASGWSPPMVGDFHTLDRFGELVFADADGKLPSPPSRPPLPMLAKVLGRQPAKVSNASAPLASPDRKVPAAVKRGEAAAAGDKK